MSTKPTELLPTEDELVEVILNYLSRSRNKPQVLKFLGQKYGGASRIKFQKFGFGPWGSFLRRHPEIGTAQNKLAFTDSIQTVLIGEHDLINIIKRVGVKYGLSEIRNVYGVGHFSRFGYGTYREFINRHQL